MIVQIATLCDSASDYNGKLCMLGAFDMLCARQFPVTHPSCSLVIRMMFTPHDSGRHSFTVRCIDSNGAEVLKPLPLDPAVDVVFPSAFVPFVTRNIILNLQNIRFERPGLINWQLEKDGQVITTIPLRVTLFDENRSTTGPAG